MKIAVVGVSKGRSGEALPLTSVAFESGTATLVQEETQMRPTVLGLIASGRMRPDTGYVTIDSAVDEGELRRSIALVDAPEVSEPPLGITLAQVVAEELMFAGLPSGSAAVRDCLAGLASTAWSSTSIENVPPRVRITVLASLAARRPGVHGLVITAPDRHGGDPVEWWNVAKDLASQGLAVLVVAGYASAAAIGADDLLERMNQTEGDAQ